MILGRPAKELVKEYHVSFLDKELWFDDILAMEGVPFNYRTDRRDQWIEHGFVYLLTVDSLNNPGGRHQIVVDYRGQDWVVYDPNRGKRSQRYYVERETISKDPKAFQLNGWAIDLVLPNVEEWQHVKGEARAV